MFTSCITFNSAYYVILRLLYHFVLKCIHILSIQANIIQQFDYHGIPRYRLKFTPSLGWRDHLLRSPRVCDLVLDTFVYGAHTTTTDMLWM